MGLIRQVAVLQISPATVSHFSFIYNVFIYLFFFFVCVCVLKKKVSDQSAPLGAIGSGTNFFCT